MNNLPSPETKDLLVEIIDRYMTTGHFSTVEGVRTRLRDKLGTFNELTRLEMLCVLKIREDDVKTLGYYPRMLAFEYVADEKRKRFAFRQVGPELRRYRERVLTTGSLEMEFPCKSECWYVSGGPRLVADFKTLVDIKCICPDQEKDRIPPVYSIRLHFKPAIRDFEDVSTAWAQELKSRGIQPVPLTRLLPKPEKAQPARVVMTGREFAFMRDATLKRIAARDYQEFQSVRLPDVIKTRFILIGSVIEAVLLDALLPQLANAMKTAVGRKEKRDLEQWGLGSLIDAAVELGIISRSAQAFGHSVREFRNFVHPGLEKRSPLVIDKAEMEIAERVLAIVLRDLTS